MRNLAMGFGIGLVVSAIAVQAFIGGKEPCEIVTGREISPAMTIICEDSGNARCDTTFTYREQW